MQKLWYLLQFEMQRSLSCITPPNETNNVYGLPAKNGSPPTFKSKEVLTLSNCELISSSFINELRDC